MLFDALDRRCEQKGSIQFPGAVYHVLDRGDRREEIFHSDADRELFLRTLGEACERTGWRVHAYVLMSNHYHLLLETPESNLVVGTLLDFSSSPSPLFG